MIKFQVSTQYGAWAVTRNDRLVCFYGSEQQAVEAIRGFIKEAEKCGREAAFVASANQQNTPTMH